MERSEPESRQIQIITREVHSCRNEEEGREITVEPEAHRVATVPHDKIK
jgi:hypothetical protein